MRPPESFIGHRLRDLTLKHNTNHRFGFRFFMLRGPDDNVGQFLLEDYTITSAIYRLPAIGEYWIAQAQDYYGQYIIRLSTRRRR